MSEQEIREDGILINALTGMGEEDYDRSVSTTVGTRTFIDKISLEELATNWICRNVIESIPREATRKWLKVSLGGDADNETIADYEDYETRLKVREKMYLAQYLANLYRGAAIVVVAEDGQDADQPINFKRLKTIRRLEVLDCHKIIPDLSGFHMDPMDPEYYRLVVDPARYPSLAKMNTRIHHSRVIRFDGVIQPPDVMLRNTPSGWGASKLEAMFDAFVDYESVHRSVAEMAQSFNIFKMAMQGLSDALRAGGEANEKLLRTRFRAMQLMMSTFKGIIVDSNKESVDFISRNFSGIAEVMDRFTTRLVGATGLPYTVLLGRGPQGLASQGAGDSEEATWANKVAQFQEIEFRPRYRRLGLMIWRAQDGPTGGQLPDDWDFKFLSLLEEDRKAELEMRSIAAQTYNTYVQMGSLLPEEVRDSQFGGSEYSIEITLDQDLWSQKQQEQQMGGFGGFGDFGGGFGAPEAETGTEEGAPAAPAEAAPGQEPAQPPLQQDSWRQDSRFVDRELYQQARQEAIVRFRVPGYHTDSWIRDRYTQLYRAHHGSLKGAYHLDDYHQDNQQGWVWISRAGKILTEQREDAVRRLPRDRAESLSLAERKAIVRPRRR